MLPIDLSKQNSCLKMTMLSLLATGLLAGCGIRGTLKTPPPVFGGDSKVDPQRVPHETRNDNDDIVIGDVDQTTDI